MAEKLFKFRVNDGHRIPGRKAEKKEDGNVISKPVVYVAGDIVEGPEWWRKEFAGRMTPIDLPEADSPEAAIDASLPKHEQAHFLRENIAKQREAIERMEAEAARLDDEATKESQERAAQRKTERATAIDAGHPVPDNSKVQVRRTAASSPATPVPSTTPTDAAPASDAAEPKQ